MKYFLRKIKSGSQTGRKIGYPTINLNIGNFASYNPPGVYKCEVIIDKSVYIGVLYFGPKLSHKGNVLEIHIIDFQKQIYGQYIRFKINNKIRNSKKFNSLAELKKQIEIDLRKI